MSLHDEVNRMIASLSPTEMKVFRQRFPGIDFDKQFEQQSPTLEDLGPAGQRLKERFARLMSPTGTSSPRTSDPFSGQRPRAMTTTNQFFEGVEKYRAWCSRLGGPSGRRGVAFASSLLGQREALDAWAATYAQGRENLSSIDGDSRNMLLEFFPFETKYGGYPEVPDCGPICCLLHAWLDTMGGCDGIRGYGH